MKSKSRNTTCDERKLPNCIITQENSYLISTEPDVKMEVQKDESEFPVTPNSFNNSKNMAVESGKQIIKIEQGDPVDELHQDYSVGREIEAKSNTEENLPSGDSKITAQTEGGEHRLEVEKDSLENRSTTQNKLLVENETQCKNKKHSCHICRNIFTRKYDLNSHLRIHSGERPYTCKVCQKTFVQKGHLDNHMLVHSGKKLHVCNICNKEYSQKSNLTSHKLSHTDEKPYTCKECHKSFTHLSFFVRHNRIHTGDKPYACNVCDKEFTQKSHLIDHVRIHSGERPYSCNLCTRSFTKKSNLNAHKLIHKN